MIVRSTAYDMRCMFGSEGSGMSCMKGLKNVVERTEPCMISFVNYLDVEYLPL